MIYNSFKQKKRSDALAIFFRRDPINLSCNLNLSAGWGFIRWIALLFEIWIPFFRASVLLWIQRWSQNVMRTNNYERDAVKCVTAVFATSWGLITTIGYWDWIKRQNQSRLDYGKLCIFQHINFFLSPVIVIFSNPRHPFTSSGLPHFVVFWK